MPPDYFEILSWAQRGSEVREHTHTHNAYHLVTYLINPNLKHNTSIPIFSILYSCNVQDSRPPIHVGLGKSRVGPVRWLLLCLCLIVFRLEGKTLQTSTNKIAVKVFINPSCCVSSDWVPINVPINRCSVQWSQRESHEEHWIWPEEPRIHNFTEWENH